MTMLMIKADRKSGVTVKTAGTGPEVIEDLYNAVYSVVESLIDGCVADAQKDGLNDDKAQANFKRMVWKLFDQGLKEIREKKSTATVLKVELKPEGEREP